MANTILDSVFEQMVKTIAERLHPLGFIRRGTVLRIMGKDTCGIVEFQRSMKSSRDRLLFTVNLGVVCGELLESGSPDLYRARIVDAHVWLRIGSLLQSCPDKWWEITTSTDPGALASEVADLTVEKAVPYLQDHLSADSIVGLWESGQSPGLTDRRRITLLAALRAKRQGKQGRGN
jgi:Domain of unknown function (DUF4304)